MPRDDTLALVRQIYHLDLHHTLRMNNALQFEASSQLFPLSVRILLFVAIIFIKELAQAFALGWR